MLTKSVSVHSTDDEHADPTENRRCCSMLSILLYHTGNKPFRGQDRTSLCLAKVSVKKRKLIARTGHYATIEMIAQCILVHQSGHLNHHRSNCHIALVIPRVASCHLYMLALKGRWSPIQ